MKSSSDLVQLNTHKSCRMLDIMDYNSKLRSVRGQEDGSTATKWIWFNKQVGDTYLCSWMISRVLVEESIVLLQFVLFPLSLPFVSVLRVVNVYQYFTQAITLGLSY